MADRPVINMANPEIGSFMWETPELLGELFEELGPEAKRHLEKHISDVLDAFLHQVMGVACSAGVHPGLACFLFHRMEDGMQLHGAEAITTMAKIMSEVMSEGGLEFPDHD